MHKWIIFWKILGVLLRVFKLYFSLFKLLYTNVLRTLALSDGAEEQKIDVYRSRDLGSHWTEPPLPIHLFGKFDISDFNSQWTNNEREKNWCSVQLIATQVDDLAMPCFSFVSWKLSPDVACKNVCLFTI